MSRGTDANGNGQLSVGLRGDTAIRWLADPDGGGRIAVALAAGRPGITLAELGAELARLRHRPPRGGREWAPSSLKALLDRARAQGLIARPG